MNGWNDWNGLRLRERVRFNAGNGVSAGPSAAMELLHRYSELEQRMTAARFGGLDEGSVSRDRKAIWEKIETEPKSRKWFQDLTRLST